jgi:hypothetical protein
MTYFIIREIQIANLRVASNERSHYSLRTCQGEKGVVPSGKLVAGREKAGEGPRGTRESRKEDEGKECTRHADVVRGETQRG